MIAGSVGGTAGGQSVIRRHSFVIYFLVRQPQQSAAQSGWARRGGEGRGGEQEFSGKMRCG